MKLKKLNSKKSKAQAMVEFAIALPVLLALLYGILEAGRLLFLYSTVVTASRQAVRYGSATGIGNGTGNASERRYQDCDGIRTAGQKAGYLGAFDFITITWDDGPADTRTSTDPNSGNPINGQVYCTDPSTDSSFTPKKDNTSRVSVTVTEHFMPLVPKLVPFIERDITAKSSRTVIVGVEIVVTPLPPPGMDSTTTIITPTDPDPSNVGPVNITVTVNGGSTSPTGTVTITGADSNCTITLSNGTGSCNVVFNSGGPKTITASYGGDSTHVASSDTENHNVKYPTVLAITSHNPDPSTTGQTVNVVVTITSGLPIPNGQTIAITGDATCSITITNGTGTCTVTFAAPTGEKTITATYAGDADHSGSSSTTTHDFIVNKDTITRITSHTPDPSEIDQAVTISVRVIGLTTTPTGTVTVSATGTTGCTITLSGGIGSCVVTFTSAGGKSITTTYTSDDADHLGSSSSTGHTVNLPATTTTITAHTPDPSEVGGTVTVTVSVTGGSTAPTGTISITGAETPCTITLPAASCDVTFSSGGTKTLSAVYSGDSLHAPSNTTASHIVNISAATPVASCNAVSHGAITLTAGGAMTMEITNPYGFPLTTGDGFVTWYYIKGHKTGGDKTLNLTNISIGNTPVWTGPTSSSIDTMNWLPSAVIPPSTTVTITFTFDQTYDQTNGLESILIYLTTPGCELNPIQS